ncbi:hypothetical protein ACJQWK_05993 [Exserohilum turcicum]
MASIATAPNTLPPEQLETASAPPPPVAPLADPVPEEASPAAPQPVPDPVTELHLEKQSWN